VTPNLVGRDSALDEFRAHILASRMSRGGGLVVEGPAGIGRSRFLDACALEAKTLGFTVMRASASYPNASFAIARGLTQHLLEAVPSTPRELDSDLFEPKTAASGRTPARLREIDELSSPTEDVHHAFSGLWLQASLNAPLLIAVDDVRRIDAPSAAVLATLLDRSSRGRTFALFGVSTDDRESAAADALARRAKVLALPLLTSDETRRLLASLFGEVSNLDMLAREIHQVSEGNPRQVMDAAEHLVAHRIVHYAAGVWTLPQRLSPEDLPRTVADAVRARVDRLSAEARVLIEAHAVAVSDRLSDSEYRALLPGLSSAQIERAIGELLSNDVLVGDASAYALPNRMWSRALAEGLSPEASAQRHRALAEMYRSRSEVDFIYHAFHAGLDDEALEAMARLNDGFASNGINVRKIAGTNIPKMMTCYPKAHECAERLGKSPRFVNELRHWNFMGMTLLDDTGYPPVANLWRAQLEHDSGLEWISCEAFRRCWSRSSRSLRFSTRYGTTPSRHVFANARAALDETVKRGLASTVDLERVLALAAAKLGDPQAAPALEALIERQKQMGVTGMSLGLSYEARAQIAIWQDDSDAFARYSELTASEYRHGVGAPLGARYDRLVNEAARRGLRATSSLADFAGSSSFETTRANDPTSLVTRTMSRANRLEERAAAALQLICSSRGVRQGQLYLTTASS
jgi:hypothetical protein